MCRPFFMCPTICWHARLVAWRGNGRKAGWADLPMLPSPSAPVACLRLHPRWHPAVALPSNLGLEARQRWRCCTYMVYLYGIPAVSTYSRARTKHSSRPTCMRTWCIRPSTLGACTWTSTREMTSLNSCILMLNGQQQRCRSATTQNKDRQFVDRGRYVQLTRLQECYQSLVKTPGRLCNILTARSKPAPLLSST